MNRFISGYCWPSLTRRLKNLLISYQYSTLQTLVKKASSKYSNIGTPTTLSFYDRHFGDMHHYRKDPKQHIQCKPIVDLLEDEEIIATQIVPYNELEVFI